MKLDVKAFRFRLICDGICVPFEDVRGAAFGVAASPFKSFDVCGRRSISILSAGDPDAVWRPLLMRSSTTITSPSSFSFTIAMLWVFCRAFGVVRSFSTLIVLDDESVRSTSVCLRCCSAAGPCRRGTDGIACTGSTAAPNFG